MLLGYNTNGLADHSLTSAIELVANIGYRSIAITLDHHTLNPYGANLDAEIDETRRLLSERRLLPVVETGARYLLDAQRKHQPTLVSDTESERQIRIDFLERAIDIADRLEAACMSFWSGAAVTDASESTLVDRLVGSLKPIIRLAAIRGVTLAFEPEPGHLVDTMSVYEQLLNSLPSQDADQLRLTIDIGHVHCQGETPIVDQLRKWSGMLENVHLDDMRYGVHQHLPFGEGEIDFQPVMATLGEINYSGPATVELPRHSHLGPKVATESWQFLQQLCEG